MVGRHLVDKHEHKHEDQDAQKRVNQGVEDVLGMEISHGSLASDIAWIKAVMGAPSTGVVANGLGNVVQLIDSIERIAAVFGPGGRAKQQHAVYQIAGKVH